MFFDSAKKYIDTAVGPAPWYWTTFPQITDKYGNSFSWKLIKKGELEYTVPLISDSDNKVRILLNIYTRAFFIPPYYLGIWFKKDGLIQVACFAPETMIDFDSTQVPKGFKQSKEPFFSLTQPQNYFSIDPLLPLGTHSLVIPDEFKTLNELLIVDSYESGREEDGIYAVFEVHPTAQEVKVLPQKWFNSNSFDTGYQWITRITRHPRTGRLIGDGIRIGMFELNDDGTSLKKWLK